MNTQESANLLIEARELLDRGQLSQARELFTRVCELDDSNAEAWLLLGAIDAETGRLEEAVTHTRQALILDPNYEEAHLTLAGLQQHQGQLEEALQSCAKALAIDSDYEEAWLMQSGIQGVLGQYEASEESSKQAIRLWPECVDAHVNLGNALKALGRWDAAIDSYRQALQLDPGQMLARVNLGYVLLEQDRLMEAESCFREVLEGNPASTEASLGMARLCLARNDPEAALVHCQTAITLDPRNISAQLSLCESMLQAGLLEEALAACSGIPVESAEDERSAALMRARILERQGEYQVALNLLQDLLERYPDNPNLVLGFAEISRHLGRTQTATTLLENHLNQQYPVTLRRQLHFSLGRLYDSDRRYTEAFEQFRQANALKSAVFDRAGHAASIDKLISAYTPEILASKSGAGNASRCPVFIVGMPRAGTTLVEQILSSHSAVFGAGELPYVGQMTVTLSGRFTPGLPYPECVRSIPGDALATLAREYLARLMEKSATAVRVTDKQNGNYLHLGLIQLLFPQAKVIHCVRDPMDTCLSLYSHDVGGEATYTRTFEDLAFYYKQYRRLMDYWHTALNVPILDICYEDLVRQQDKKTRELLQFCELPWEEQCLYFHENRRAVATPSHAQVRQPMYMSSIGRWKKYQANLSSLSSLLAD